jgi:hypothetical protein
MHCLDELHSLLNSLALIICYILIPWLIYSGTSYRPLATPIYQLSILLLLDCGWYSGLGLRCERSWCVLACVLGAYFLDVFWRERAFWLLVNACLGRMWSGLLPERRVGRDGDGECSLSTLKDRSSVDLASDDFYHTNCLPYYGRGCGVRLIVDSTPPVGGSAWSCRETALPP